MGRGTAITNTRGTTGSDVQELAQKILQGIPFVVATTREPYEHVRKAKTLTLQRTIGGVTAALEPVMEATQGTWIAWGSGEADREAVDDHERVGIPAKKPQYHLRRVWLTENEVRDYYEGHVNQTLWPLCHL